MITAFLHPKGGVGKSLLSFNFAVYQMLKGKDVVLIDLDGQHSILSFNRVRLANSELKPLNIKTFSSDMELVSFLDSVRDENVVIDTGGFDSSYNRAVLSYADKIITPTSDSPIELRRLKDFSGIVRETSSKLGKKIVANILFNRLHPSLRNLDNIKDIFGDDSFNFLNSTIKDRARIKSSISFGMSVFEESGAIKDLRAIEELSQAFEEIEAITD